MRWTGPAIGHRWHHGPFTGPCSSLRSMGYRLAPPAVEYETHEAVGGEGERIWFRNDGDGKREDAAGRSGVVGDTEQLGGRPAAVGRPPQDLAGGVIGSDDVAGGRRRCGE